jgi:hypothetical protein
MAVARGFRPVKTYGDAAERRMGYAGADKRHFS